MLNLFINHILIWGVSFACILEENTHSHSHTHKASRDMYTGSEKVILQDFEVVIFVILKVQAWNLL